MRDLYGLQLLHVVGWGAYNNLHDLARTCVHASWVVDLCTVQILHNILRALA